MTQGMLAASLPRILRLWGGFGLVGWLLVSLDALMAYTYRPTPAWLTWSDWLSRAGAG